MKNLTVQRSFYLLAIFALAAFVATPSLFAQGSGVLSSGGWVSDAQLAVWELPSRDEIHRLKGGSSFDMAAGETVMLRIFSPRGSNASGERKYLSARIYLSEGANLAQLRNIDQGKGSAEIQVLPRAAGRTITVNYDLARSYQTRGIGKSGSFRIHVGGKASGDHDGGYGAPSGPVAAGAEGDVQRLFRGILLREPNAGADDFIRTVRRDGYPALVSIAYQIAESRESRGLNTNPDERLAALYSNLLDVDRNRVPRNEWDAQIDRVRAGRVVDAVMEIVQSETFQRRHSRR